jgi:hypothetical protein
MAVTTNRQYPYPAPTADPDVPYWNQQLAEALDLEVVSLLGKLGRLPYKVTAGTGALAVAAANTTVSSNVSFGSNTFDTPPIVLISSNTNALKASVYSAYSSTTTGFTAKVQTADGSTYGASFSLAFNWVAIQLLAP